MPVHYGISEAEPDAAYAASQYLALFKREMETVRPEMKLTIMHAGLSDLFDEAIVCAFVTGVERGKKRAKECQSTQK